ncbi:sigma factor-like helix-turn-helix DNA-binding protein [Variovorax soli]|uniref:sigma factor-like helix-turn-helix DNA-binding protein n=1 Tax=Variovorax soli TaxID=376815 RepID=UPI0008380731|nr:sigma factor-like helix-turn-helix DNA-binding protein [Variovorax soli]
MSTGKPVARKVLEAPVERAHSTEPMTLQEVGEALGVTRERVRQIEERALRKCATLLAERGISADILDDELGATASLLATMSRNMRR